MQPSSTARDDATEMHLFDIRLSHSISDLWKQFEIPTQPRIMPAEAQTLDVPSDTGDAPSNQEQHASDANAAKIPEIPSTENDSQPLLAAFESEISKLLDAEKNPDVEPPQQGPSPTAEAPPRASPERPPNPAEAFAHTVHNILDRAEMVRGELQSRLPEFERQLHDAQRALPGQVGTTLQGALSTLETHVGNMANVLNNISGTRDQRTTQGSQASSCPAAHTVDGFRTMASDIGQMGQTLFAAFDQGFGHNQRQSRPPHNEDTGSTPEDQKEAHADDSTAPDTISNNEATASYQDTSVHEKKTVPSAEHANPELQKADTTNPAADNPAPAQESPGPSFGPPYTQCQPPKQMLSPPHISGHRSPGIVTSGHISIPAAPPLPPMPPVSSIASVPSELGPKFWRREPSSTGRTSSIQSGPREHRHSTKRPVDSLRDESESQKDVPSKTLFIGNVGYKVTEGMIRNVFNLNGFLVKVHLPLDSGTKQHAGFGYLEFATVQGAKAAMEVLQGALIDGHSINLEFSDSPPITGLHTQHQATSVNRRAAPSTAKRLGTEDNATAAGAVEESSQDSNKNRTSYKIKTANFEGTDSIKGLRDAPKPANDAGSSRHPVGILDEDNEDAEFSARYPSLLPGSNVYQPSSGRLPRLSPGLEMSRFPPVSQLDAHVLANQCGETPVPKPPVPPKSEHNEGEKPTPAVPGSFPEDSYNIPEREAKSTTPSYDGLRRANTMAVHIPTNPRPSESRFPVNPNNARQPIHRRATERPRQGHTHHHRIPAPSASTSSTPNRYAAYMRDANAKVQQRYKIYDCVTTLCRLGYGSVHDGGEARMTVYAEAAGGNVWEAIEMIEEERKAYAQRGF